MYKLYNYTCSFQIWLLSLYYEYVNAVYPTVLFVEITFVLAYIGWKYVFIVGMEITYIWFDTCTSFTMFSFRSEPLVNRTDRMKIFNGCQIVLDLSTSVGFKKKQEIRKKITDNGGIISYIVTKKVLIRVKRLQHFINVYTECNKRNTTV